ncbi:MAG: PEP/pyruvate-binding domain-containing protein [Bacillota bacterium]
MAARPATEFSDWNGLTEAEREQRRRRFTAFDPLSIPAYRALTTGEGTVGGKAKGLLFASEALRGDERPESCKVHVPESRFLATGLFREFMASHGLDHAELSEQDGPGVERAFLSGSLCAGLRKDLERLVMEMDYPLAVRSSSALEDSLRYSFAGKYLTVFIPNRGTPATRTVALEQAIKLVYASTYGPNAVAYRKKHGLPHEEMGVIIQRLQGRERGGYFYPELAGVGFSRNFRRWTERIRVEDGVARIVFGLGTRCTGRGYARTFSLTDPNLRPEGNVTREIVKYSQEVMDALDLDTGHPVSLNINDCPHLAGYHPSFPAYAQWYSAEEDAMVDTRFAPAVFGPGDKFVFTFNHLRRYYPEIFRLTDYLFRLLEHAMGLSADIEFTFESADHTYSLIQARPLTSWEEYRKVKAPDDLDPKAIILRGDRMLTNGELRDVKYLVYVDPWQYRQAEDKYEVAREVGRVNRQLAGEHYILVGPGRWGSSSPHYGVPVNYSEISNCGMLVEVGIRAESFVPELSYGTHFFADLDVGGTLYMPVFDTEPTNIFRREWFDEAPARATGHRALKVFSGRFNAYLDGREMDGLVVSHSHDG